MDTNAPEAYESSEVYEAPRITGDQGRPRPEWVRGRCPACGDDLVSNHYEVGGKGYLIVWDCWTSLSQPSVCSYRKIL